MTHSCEITVLPHFEPQFTSILQSGIQLPCSAGTTVGAFLSGIPGFDHEYITGRIQTIFLDGSAIDDLGQRLTQREHALALSAAMPGLAGAIFRKDSICAPLRGQKKQGSRSDQHQELITVNLKLFNMIAREKGKELLRLGQRFKGSCLVDFLQSRPHLVDGISRLSIDDQVFPANEYIYVFTRDDYYNLKVIPNCDLEPDRK